VKVRPSVARALVVTVMTLVTLGVSEVVVRVVANPFTQEITTQREVFPFYYPLAEAGMLRRDPDPELRYTLTPEFEMRLGADRYTVNSLGFRDREVAVARPGHTERVVVVGDSFAFGLGVDQDETLAAQLETRLENDRPSVEVLNLGVPGYHTGQENALLEKAGFDLDPSVVVLLFYGNDQIEEGFQWDPAHHVLYGDALPVPYVLKGVLGRSALYRWMARWHIGRLRERGELSSLGPRHWPVTEERLEALHSACEDHGVGLVLANLPLLWSSAALRDPSWVGNADYDRVSEWAETRGVPWVDLRGALLSTARGDGDDFLRRLLISPDPPQDHHLTPEGYSLVADAVRPMLIESLRLAAQK
jgi:hypothetical protein